jgi:hypothetical protein
MGVVWACSPVRVSPTGRPPQLSPRHPPAFCSRTPQPVPTPHIAGRSARRILTTQRGFWNQGHNGLLSISLVHWSGARHGIHPYPTPIIRSKFDRIDDLCPGLASPLRFVDSALAARCEAEARTLGSKTPRPDRRGHVRLGDELITHYKPKFAVWFRGTTLPASYLCLGRSAQNQTSGL